MSKVTYSFCAFNKFDRAFKLCHCFVEAVYDGFA
jgi:hypothetical protein